MKEYEIKIGLNGTSVKEYLKMFRSMSKSFMKGNIEDEIKGGNMVVIEKKTLLGKRYMIFEEGFRIQIEERNIPATIKFIKDPMGATKFKSFKEVENAFNIAYELGHKNIRTRILTIYGELV